MGLSSVPIAPIADEQRRIRFSPGFFKESITNFRSWIDVLLVEAWEACQGADVLIESPVTMAGIRKISSNAS